MFETGEYDDVEPRLSDVGVRAGPAAAPGSRSPSPSARASPLASFAAARSAAPPAITAEGDGVITVRKGLKAGRYRIGVRAEDLAGNRSAKQTLRLTVR